MNTKPPCWRKGQRPNACAAALYDAQVHNHLQLHGPWAGWQLRGRDLVAPDGQRISPERLRGLLWRQDSEDRVARAAARRRAELERRRRQSVKVVVVELAEIRKNGFLAG